MPGEGDEAALEALAEYESKYGRSPVFVLSTFQEEGVTSSLGPVQASGGSTLKEAIHVLSCGYEDQTAWGKEVRPRWPCVLVLSLVGWLWGKEVRPPWPCVLVSGARRYGLESCGTALAPQVHGSALRSLVFGGACLLRCWARGKGSEAQLWLRGWLAVGRLGGSMGP